MELTSEQLEMFLEVLREAGVEEFEGCGFHVKFRATPPSFVTAEDRYPTERPAGSSVPKSVWDNDALWGDAPRPSFPKKDK